MSPLSSTMKQPTAHQTLEHARQLQREGVHHGLYNARVVEAQTCFDACNTELQPLLNSGDHDTQIQARRCLVQTCIHQAELQLMLFHYPETQEACQRAMKHHTQLGQLWGFPNKNEAARKVAEKENDKDTTQATEETQNDDQTSEAATLADLNSLKEPPPKVPNSRNDVCAIGAEGGNVTCVPTGDNNIDNDLKEPSPSPDMLNPICRANLVEWNVLKADILRCQSIVDYRLGNDLHKQWDTEATGLLRTALEYDVDCPQAQSLLGLFLSYQITTGDTCPQTAVTDSQQAIEWLGALYEADATMDLHARRLAVVLRLASYAFRDVGQWDEALEAVQGALTVATSLTKKRPRAPTYWFELYHCWCAHAEHCELSDEHDDVRVLLDARKEAAASLKALTQLLPMVPKYWRSLCTTLIDVADLQDRQNDHTSAKASVHLALEAATSCLQCPPKKKEPTSEATNDNGDPATNDAVKDELAGVDEAAFEDLVEYARALLECGRHGFIQKEYESALEYYETALKLYKDKILKMDRATREDEFYQELVLRSLTAARNCAAAGDLDHKALEWLPLARNLTLNLRKTKVMYANTIVELAGLHRKHRHAHYALELLEELEHSTLDPLLQEFPWHTTLHSVSSQAVLCMAQCWQDCCDRTKEICCRQRYLTLAAERHGKDYSEWTAASPQDDDDWLERLRDTCDAVPAVKRYRLPVKNTTTGQVTWHSIEIGSAIAGVDDPLVDQARVWKEDFGVSMSEEIRESFCKLHTLALGNNVPFTEICDYALNSNTDNDNANNNGPDDRTVSTSGESAASQSDDDDDEDEADDNDDYTGNQKLAAVPLVIRIEEEGDSDTESDGQTNRF